MCLTTVDKEPKHTRRVTGYKVLARDTDGTLSGLFFGKLFEVGKTYTDRKRRPIRRDCGSEYPTGYHIYINEKDAWADSYLSLPRVPVKVSFSKVVASGKEYSYTVVVARKMKILEVL